MQLFHITLHGFLCSNAHTIPRIRFIFHSNAKFKHKIPRIYYWIYNEFHTSVLSLSSHTILRIVCLCVRLSWIHIYFIMDAVYKGMGTVSPYRILNHSIQMYIFIQVAASPFGDIRRICEIMRFVSNENSGRDERKHNTLAIFYYK